MNFGLYSLEPEIHIVLKIKTDFNFTMKEITTNKLKDITESLLHYKEDDIGLFSGICGQILFFSNSKKNDFRDLIKRNIELVISKINNGYNYPTFCFGIAGVVWTIEHLISKKLIERKDAVLLYQLDEYLYRMMHSEIKNRNYDFLHGSIGIGVSLCKRKSSNIALKGVIELVESLYDDRIVQSGNSMAWEFKVWDGESFRKVVNLSLSHGMASIISFCSLLLKSGIDNVKIRSVLNGAANYFVQYLAKPRINESIFPSWVENGEPLYPSRMAWCYGDVGIASALFSAHEATGTSEFKDAALEIFSHNATRRCKWLVDPGFCHGAAGLSHMYRRIYNKTGIQSYCDTSNYWLQVLMNMAIYEDGIAGYKINNNFDSERVKSYDLLDGVSGIGLVLQEVEKKRECTWEECFLLV